MKQEAPFFPNHTAITSSSVGWSELIKKRPSPKDWELFGALQGFNNPQQISPDWAIFNTTFIPTPKLPGTIVLSRAVYIGNVREGEPDRNILPVCVIDQKGNRRRLRDLGLPVNDILVNWEDGRMGPNGTLGFTVVIQEDDKYSVHPALVNVGIRNGNLEVIGNLRIFENLTGKNVIPLKDGFVYRPEDVSHQLYHLDPQGELLGIIDFSKFKNIEWLSKRIGIVAKPIELEDGLKLLFIHGVRGNEIGIDGCIKDCIYALGLAIVDTNWHLLAVDEQPLLERKDFLGNLLPENDLDSKKEVVYLCDYMQQKDGLILPVNVGDRITVFRPFSYSLLRTRIARFGVRL